MNAKPTAYPILGHKHSKERGGLEPPRPLQPPDITGNHLPILRPLFSILDTTILSELQNCANKYHFFQYDFVKFNLVPFSPKPHSVQR